MQKPDKLSLSPSEMKGEKVNPRGDQLKCPVGHDALNCDRGDQFSGFISDRVNGLTQNVGIVCVGANGAYTQYCSGYGSGSGTVSCPSNDVDACAGLASGSECSWVSNGNRYSGKCANSQIGVLYCKTSQSK